MVAVIIVPDRFTTKPVSGQRTTTKNAVYIRDVFFFFWSFDLHINTLIIKSTIEYLGKKRTYDHNYVVNLTYEFYAAIHPPCTSYLHMCENNVYSSKATFTTTQ